MKIQDHYDWIVIGDHPAALLTANLVARLGLSVLILPLTPHLNFLTTPTGQYFDSESNFLLGLSSGSQYPGLLTACLNQIGILPEEFQLFRSSCYLTQVLTPSVRLDFLSHKELIHEFSREFGKDISNRLGLTEAIEHSELEFLNYWNSITMRLSLNPDRKKSVAEPMTINHLQRKISKTLGTHDLSVSRWASKKLRASDLDLTPESLVLIRELFAGLFHNISSRMCESPRLFDLLHMLAFSRISGSIKGGMTAYRKLLMNSARRHGVHIPLKTECKQIFIEKGKFVGVQVNNRGNMISARGGVLGCSFERASRQMTVGGKSRFQFGLKKTVPNAWKFTIALTVRQEVIPKKMMPRLIWKEQGAPPLEIEVVHPSDYSPAHYNPGQSDHRVIYIRTLMSYTVESLNPQFQRLTAARMLRQVSEIIPYLEFHVVQIFPDFRGGSHLTESFHLIPEIKSETEKDELTQLYRFSSLEEIPDSLLVFHPEEHKGSQIKEVGSSSGIDGLFRVSNESYPSLGSLGPVVAGLEAVGGLAHRSGLSGPFG